MVEYPSTPRDCNSITISSMNSLAMESNHMNAHNFDLPQALEDEYGRWISLKIMGGQWNSGGHATKKFNETYLQKYPSKMYLSM
ncbi:hypothetical protein PIB30_064439 [Stylosanthes scabra]|uniref:Uncharacterized protein n=1 Tax=Stylosanthes scabra TaxID=79078 RepID=A0ABU6RMI7_9FABA|nr:hypothetical protein [Stylosanthes scabra]